MPDAPQDRPKPAKKGSMSFSEWKKLQEGPSAPQDRGSSSTRRPSAYEKAQNYMMQMDGSDIREDMADREAGYAGLAQATSYARHAKSERTTRGGKYDEPVKMALKPKEGKYPNNPEAGPIGGKYGKSWNGKD